MAPFFKNYYLYGKKSQAFFVMLYKVTAIMYGKISEEVSPLIIVSEQMCKYLVRQNVKKGSSLNSVLPHFTL